MALPTASVVGRALLMPHAWRTYGLHQWPDSSPYHQVVGDLFKCWGQRTDSEETDLQLFDFETASISESFVWKGQKSAGVF